MTRKNLPSKEPWCSRTQKIVGALISFLVLAGMFWNYVAKADGRYAKDVQVKEAFQVVVATNAYLDSKISVLELNARRGDVQSRLWSLEKEFSGRKWPEAVMQQKVSLEKDLKDIDEAIAVFRAEGAKNRQQMPAQPVPDVSEKMSVNPYLQRK